MIRCWCFGVHLRSHTVKHGLPPQHGVWHSGWLRSLLINLGVTYDHE